MDRSWLLSCGLRRRTESIEGGGHDQAFSLHIHMLHTSWLFVICLRLLCLDNSRLLRACPFSLFDLHP